MAKIYIGDGAYAEINRFSGLVLTTEDGINVQNTVVIEPEVYLILEDFIHNIRTAEVGRWRHVEKRKRI